MTAVIAGVGMTRPTPHQDVLVGAELAASAFVEALGDAGLERGQVEGLVVQHGQTGGPDYDEFAQFMNLDVEFCYQMWAHGRLTGSAIQLGAMMIDSGAVDVVACVTGYRSEYARIGGIGGTGFNEEVRTRNGGGPHGEQPYVGLTAPLGQAAMALRSYQLTYDVSPDRLYDVVAAERGAAMKNPNALRQRELTYEQYIAEPHVVAPLRRPDCSPVSEAGSCIILAREEKVPSRGIRILGHAGVPAGREEFIWSRPGLGLWMQSGGGDFEVDDRVFARSGVSRSDVDLYYTYDSFSPLVWFGLERYGYCGPGQAADFIADTGIGLDGGLPTNTSGGMLCEASRAGWGHLIEAVRQLRGEAGDRQVKDAEIAHWGACFGESLLFGKA
jgi:acetyl-CoA acetyltransferase